MSKIFESQDIQSGRDHITEEILTIYSQRGCHTPFHIGMSGGSVLWVLDMLQERLGDRENIEIYQIDERFVPQDHPDSNARAMIEKIAGTRFTFIPFPLLSSPGASAKQYAEILENITLDIAILGCGPDGHTASIFPHDLKMDTLDLTYATTTDVFAVRDRMTMSFAFIERSAHVFLIMEGEKKREIFEKITDISTDYHEYPARKILDFKEALICFSH